MASWTIAQTVDLGTGEISKVISGPLMLPGDNLGHIWRIKVMNNGSAASLSGTPTAYFQRVGGTVVYASANIADGNICRVQLPRAAYAVPGPLRCVMRLVDGSRITTIAVAVMTVADGLGDGSYIAAEGSTLPDLAELLQAISDMESASSDVSKATRDGARYTAGSVVLPALENGYYNTNTGAPTNVDTYVRTKYYFRIAPHMGVRKHSEESLPNNVQLLYYDNDHNYLGYSTLNSSSLGAITPTKCAYCQVNYALNGGSAPSSIMLDVVDGSGVLSFNQDVQQSDPGILKVFEGKYVNSSGALVASDNFKAVIIPNCAARRLMVNLSATNQCYMKDYDGNALTPTASEPVTYNASENASGMIYTLPDHIGLLAVNIHQDSGYCALLYTTAATRHAREREMVGAVPTPRMLNKRIAAIGDSITRHDGANYGGQARLVGWQAYLRMLGADVRTYADNGAPYATNAEEDICLANWITSVLKPNLKATDVAILFGGSNDVRLGNPIGAENASYDSPNVNPANFIGAVGAIINYCRSQNPAIELFLCTILPSSGGSRGWAKTKPYNDALRHCSEFWSVPLIDVHSRCNIHPGQNTDTYFEDTVHPNYVGMERVGRVIASEVERYLTNVR